MPSDESGWRSTAGYDYVERLGASDLAWEWLRRNKHYAQDYATLSKAAPDDVALKTALLDKWGLRFRSRSDIASTKDQRALGSPDRSGRHPLARGTRGTQRRGPADDPSQGNDHTRPGRPPSSS